MTDRRYCVNCVFFQSAPEPHTGEAAIRFGRCSDVRAQNEEFKHVRPGSANDEYLSPDMELQRMPFAAIIRGMPAACGPDGNWYQEIQNPPDEDQE